MYKNLIDFIREIFNNHEGFIPLHEPKFIGNEKKYLEETIDSTFVSSVGAFVDKFEKEIAKVGGTKYAVATVNGTAALHVCLRLAGVEKETDVITQPLSFVATANAIKYLDANPVFVDVDRDTLSLSPEKLLDFLKNQINFDDKGNPINKSSGNRVSACVPMHTFGFPGRISEIIDICSDFNIPVVEDAAEGIGSTKGGKPLGSFGLINSLSFNGNKIITSGGGGAILTNDKTLAEKAKYITTTAKVPHKWEYVHDELGYNYRMPNLNAALLCAQIENLKSFIENKRELAKIYSAFFEKTNWKFFDEPEGTKSNYWLNVVLVKNLEERNQFLKETNENGIMTRPVWKLLNTLPMYRDCITGDLSNAHWLEDRIINIPSSVRINK